MEQQSLERCHEPTGRGAPHLDWGVRFENENRSGAKKCSDVPKLYSGSCTRKTQNSLESHLGTLLLDSSLTGSGSRAGCLAGLLSTGKNLSLADLHSRLLTNLGRGGVRTLCSPAAVPYMLPVQLPSSPASCMESS